MTSFCKDIYFDVGILENAALARDFWGRNLSVQNNETYLSGSHVRMCFQGLGSTPLVPQPLASHGSMRIAVDSRGVGA